MHSIFSICHHYKRNCSVSGGGGGGGGVGGGCGDGGGAAAGMGCLCPTRDIALCQKNQVLVGITHR